MGDTRLTEVDAHKHHTLTTTKDHDNHQPAQGKGTERKEKRDRYKTKEGIQEGKKYSHKNIEEITCTSPGPRGHLKSLALISLANILVHKADFYCHCGLHLALKATFTHDTILMFILIKEWNHLRTY